MEGRRHIVMLPLGESGRWVQGKASRSVASHGER